MVLHQKINTAFAGTPTTVVILCVWVCRTLPLQSAYGHRPVCRQHVQSPRTPPQGQEGSPEGTREQSGSHWDPPQRSGPRQEHPDQFLRDRKVWFKCNFHYSPQLHPSDSLWEAEMIMASLQLSHNIHQAKTNQVIWVEPCLVGLSG